MADARLVCYQYSLWQCRPTLDCKQIRYFFEYDLSRIGSLSICSFNILPSHTIVLHLILSSHIICCVGPLFQEEQARATPPSYRTYQYTPMTPPSTWRKKSAHTVHKVPNDVAWRSRVDFLGCGQEGRRWVMRDTTGNDHQSSPGGFETNPVCFGSLEKNWFSCWPGRNHRTFSTGRAKLN
jgi:hypothetical protein